MLTVAEVYTSWSASQGHISAKTVATRKSAWHSRVEPRWGAVAAVADVKTAAVRAWVAKLKAKGVGVPGIENASGLRWREMAALRVCDLDMLRRRVNVSRSVTESGGLVWTPGKTHERRSVPFPAVLAEELSALMAGKARDVFTDMRGGVLRNSNWRARVFAPAVAICQKADESFPAITPHDLRHTAASLAISAGANVKAVQRMLGHALASMTLDTYADLFDTDLDDVAVNLDAAIRAAADARRKSRG